MGQLSMACTWSLLFDPAGLQSKCENSQQCPLAPDQPLPSSCSSQTALVSSTWTLLALIFLWKCECPSLSNGRRADLQIWWSRCNPSQMHEGEEYCCYIKEIDFGLQVCTGKSRYNREHTVNLFFFPHGRHYWIRSRHLAGRIACPETNSMGKWWANYSRAEFGYGQTLKKDKAA